MDDKFNTASGWVLFAGIIALGSAIVSGIYFQADKPVSPEEPGYFIDAPEDAGGGAAAEMSIAEALTLVTAEDGEKVWAKCSACHTIEQGGANGIGPNLYNTMGLAVAGHAGYAYSDALKGVGGTWDWENMSAWLKSPRSFANGTKMSFAGLSKVEDRAALMLYMNTFGSGIAVPEFTPEAESSEGGEETVEAETEAEEDVAAEAEAEQDAAAEINEGEA